MLQAGIEADTAIQNSVMRLAKQQGQSPAQLEEHLLRLLTLGLQPNEQTFNVLLRAYLAHGNAGEATRILDRMGTHGMTLVLFSILQAADVDDYVLLKLRRAFVRRL